jgi:hypothetical protein
MAIRKDGTQGWSTWEFMLHHCFSIMNDTEDSPFDFANVAMSTSLLTVLSDMVKNGADQNAIIVLTSRSNPKHTEENRAYRHISALLVVLPLLNRICSTVSRDMPEGFNKITMLSRSITWRLRKASAIELDELHVPVSDSLRPEGQ